MASFVASTSALAGSRLPVASRGEPQHAPYHHSKRELRQLTSEIVSARSACLVLQHITRSAAVVCLSSCPLSSSGTQIVSSAWRIESSRRERDQLIAAKRSRNWPPSAGSFGALQAECPHGDPRSQSAQRRRQKRKRLVVDRKVLLSRCMLGERWNNGKPSTAGTYRLLS